MPAGAVPGPISVTTSQLTVTSAASFYVTAAGCNTPLSQTSFDTSMSFPVLGESWSLPAADIDGDGKTDFAVASFNNSNKVLVYRNTGSPGAIAFAPATDFAAGAVPYDPVLADFDGDGRPDLIVTHPDTAQANLSVFRNTSSPGSISFAPGNSISADNRAVKLYTADIDGDGKTDLVMTTAAVPVFWVMKNISSPGNISFDPMLSFTCPADNFAALFDADGDGKTDLAAIGRFGNQFHIVRNTSTSAGISFAAPVNIATNGDPFGIAAGDVDGDGKPDIAITCRFDNRLGIYRNTSAAGAISFAPVFNIVSPRFYETNGLLIKDITGDGREDIIGGTSAKGMAVLRNNNSTPGTIVFDTAQRYPFAYNPIALTAADWDNDGKTDMLCGTGQAGTAYTVSILRNQLCESNALCAGGSTVLTATVAGSTYQWQADTGAGFADITNSSVYSGTATNQLTLSNLTTAYYGYRYRCIADGTPGLPFTIKFSTTWTGTVSNAWENPANWSCGQLPDAATDVVVSSGSVLLSSNTIIRSLTIMPGASVTVAPGFTLTVTN